MSRSSEVLVGGAVRSGIEKRLAALDWFDIERELGERGYAEAPPVLSPEECESLVALYGEERHFRARVEMARHRFGEGDYQYFTRPLPAIVEELRTHAYPPLAAIANRWNAALDIDERHPPTLRAFLARCPRTLPGERPPWSEPAAVGEAVHPGSDLSRCEVMVLDTPFLDGPCSTTQLALAPPAEHGSLR